MHINSRVIGIQISKKQWVIKLSSHEKKLKKAKHLLESCLGNSIENLLFQPKLSRIKIRL